MDAFDPKPYDDSLFGDFEEESPQAAGESAAPRRRNRPSQRVRREMAAQRSSIRASSVEPASVPHGLQTAGDKLVGRCDMLVRPFSIAVALFQYLASRVSGLFGRTAAMQRDLHDETSSQGREQAGAWLQAHGFTQINNKSDCKVQTDIKMTDLTVGLVVDGLDAGHDEVRAFLSKNLEMLRLASVEKAPIMDQMILTIDGRGGVVEGVTTDATKDLLRVMVVVFAGQVEKHESGLAFVTSDQVHESISDLGEEFATIANQMRDFGITGAYLACHALEEDDLREHFGLEHPLKRKAVLSQLSTLKQKPLNTCALAVLTNEMTFTWRQMTEQVQISEGDWFSDPVFETRNIPGPSLEEVQEKLKTMQQFHCVRHLKNEIEKIEQPGASGANNWSLIHGGSH